MGSSVTVPEAWEIGCFAALFDSDLINQKLRGFALSPKSTDAAVCTNDQRPG